MQIFVIVAVEIVLQPTKRRGQIVRCFITHKLKENVICCYFTYNYFGLITPIINHFDCYYSTQRLQVVSRFPVP